MSAAALGPGLSAADATAAGTELGPATATVGPVVADGIGGVAVLGAAADRTGSADRATCCVVVDVDARGAWAGCWREVRGAKACAWNDVLAGPEKRVNTCC